MVMPIFDPNDLMREIISLHPDDVREVRVSVLTKMLSDVYNSGLEKKRSYDSLMEAYDTIKKLKSQLLSAQFDQRDAEENYAKLKSRKIPKYPHAELVNPTENMKLYAMLRPLVKKAA